MKRQVTEECIARGESEAVIVREALREYFERRQGKSVPSVPTVMPPISRAELNEPISYKKK